MLGGEDYNHDALDRKEIFIKCLEENGLPYSEDFFEATDMSSHTEAAGKHRYYRHSMYAQEARDRTASADLSCR